MQLAGHTYVGNAAHTFYFIGIYISSAPRFLWPAEGEDKAGSSTSGLMASNKSAAFGLRPSCIPLALEVEVGALVVEEERLKRGK